MLHLCMSVRVMCMYSQCKCIISCNMTSHQVHKQLQGVLYEVKTSLYTSTGCNWKGSFTGEVLHDPDQQHCFVSGSLALCSR